MMRKIYLTTIFLFLLISNSPLNAIYSQCVCTPACCVPSLFDIFENFCFEGACPRCYCARTSVELRAGAFFPISSDVRRFYGKPLPFYEVEVSTNLCTCFDYFVNFDWTSKQGQFDDDLNSNNRIEIGNFSFGIKYPFAITDCSLVYFGIGPSLGWAVVKNDSFPFDFDSTKFIAGVVLKSGINYYFSSYFFVDLFFDYLFQPVHFHHTRVDMGGIRTGAGIGYTF